MNDPNYDGYGGNRPDYHDYNDHAEYQRHPPMQGRSNPRSPSIAHRERQALNTGHYAPMQGRVGQPGLHDQYYPQEPAWDPAHRTYGDLAQNQSTAGNDNYGQWPLPSTTYQSSPRRGANDSRRPRQLPHRAVETTEGADPRQPIRDQPRSSSHIAGAGRRQPSPQMQSHHGNGQWTGDGYSYAPPSQPPPNHPPPQQPRSRQAQPSMLQHPTARSSQNAPYSRTNNPRAPLGPPPSARRGPAQYYPDRESVHPIVEETVSIRSIPRAGGGVQAHRPDNETSSVRSNTITSRAPHDYSDNHNGPRPSDDERSIRPGQSYETSHIDQQQNDRTVTPIRNQESPEVMLRKASVGKKSRPVLTEVKSGVSSSKSSTSDQAVPVPSQQARVRTQDWPDRQAEADAMNEKHSSGRRSSPVMSEAANALELVHVQIGSGTRTPEEVLRSGTGLVEASDSSESERELRRKKSKELLGTTITNELHPQRSQPRSPLAPKNNDRAKSILDSLEKGGAMTADDADVLKKPMGGLSEKAGNKCPPRLDLGAVRNAEARGSLTSLPDLIKRATRLASNLDRGKTASRLGMNWFDGAAPTEKRQSGSISDALNSFPLPYASTPVGSRTDLRRSMLSGRNRHSALASDSDAGEAPKPKRRCCGLPLWSFILLLVLLLILVAAAVVLPVVFVVLPKESASNNSNSASRCSRELPCENGGASITSDNGACECICRNGYYGKTCSAVAIQGCTMASIGGTDDATLGEAIPRLLEASQTNFSIPLDGEQLLGLFSATEMNCVSQNALVTFNNQASRRSQDNTRDRSLPGVSIAARQATASTATNNGIIYATASASGAAAASSSSPTSTSTSSSVGVVSNGNAQGGSKLDFARVAVLYVFQASGDLNSAATAQEKLQSYFRDRKLNDTSAGDANISLGGSFVCDLAGYTIDVGNGTTVGGGRVSS